MKHKELYNKQIIMLAGGYYLLVTILTIALYILGDSNPGGTGSSVLENFNKDWVLDSTLVTGSVSAESPDTEPEEEPAQDEGTEAESYEEPAEAAPEAEEIEEPAGEIPHYYSFITTNHDTILNVREKPDINARKIQKLRPGQKGYIVELGDEWSYVNVPEGNIYGFCSNEYLSMTEIPEGEYPEELKNYEVPETDGF